MEDISGVRASNVGGEVNHIPAWNSIEIASKMNPELQNLPTHGTTPAIYMDRPDHRAMSSTGSSRNAKLWRKKQAELINQGKFKEAMEMDIDEVISKHGTKYNDNMKEMIDYAYSKGYIDEDSKTNLKNKIDH